MATLKQKKLAKGIAEAFNAKEIPLAKELIVSAGYDLTTAEASPGRTIAQKGVQEELEQYGFTEDNARSVVAEILLNKKVNPMARLVAADRIFKVKGSYAAEKSIVAHIPLIVKILHGKGDADSGE